MSAARTPTGHAIARQAEPTSPPPAASVEPAYELVDIDRYEVLDHGPVGYVEVIPPLFICYSGHPYPKAIEMAQVFDFEEAVRLVREAAPHSPASRGHGLSAA
ncbi:hypothetical protein [Microbacterium sp.]|uniref:hypothetical protein n=1 Tax=Microbacterium sp. TaxID=51671 RepID=UPI0028B0E3E8|nr:hypothetical protein [Microbacterium sp.]